MFLMLPTLKHSLTSYQVATATRKDPTLRNISLYLIRMLSTMGIRVIISQKWQQILLSELHRDHPGILRIKQVACSFVWWEETLVKSHKNCQTKKFGTHGTTLPLALAIWTTEVIILVDFAETFQGRCIY